MTGHPQVYHGKACIENERQGTLQNSRTISPTILKHY